MLREAYKVNKCLAVVLFAAGIIPGVIYLGAIAYLNRNGGKKVLVPREKTPVQSQVNRAATTTLSPTSMIDPKSQGSYGTSEQRRQKSETKVATTQAKPTQTPATTPKSTQNVDHSAPSPIQQKRKPQTKEEEAVIKFAAKTVIYSSDLPKDTKTGVLRGFLMATKSLSYENAMEKLKQNHSASYKAFIKEHPYLA